MSKSSLIYYYHIFSQPSRAIKIILDSNKIQYTPQKIDLFQGEHLQDEFKNITRFQKVPVIKHNDFVLTESVAIARYLSRETNIADHLYPEDSIKQAQVDEFLEWHHIELRHPCMSYFFYKFIRTVATGKQPNPERVNLMHTQMVAACDKIEQFWLNDTPYVCGNNITIADIFGACELEQPTMAGYDPRDGRPKLSAWFKRVEQDLHPYYTESHKLVREVALKYKNKLPESFAKL